VKINPNIPWKKGTQTLTFPSADRIRRGGTRLEMSNQGEELDIATRRAITSHLTNNPRKDRRDFGEQTPRKCPGTGDNRVASARKGTPKARRREKHQPVAHKRSNYRKCPTTGTSEGGGETEAVYNATAPPKLQDPERKEWERIRHQGSTRLEGS